MASAKGIKGIFSGFGIEKEDARKTGRFLGFFIIVFVALKLFVDFVLGSALENFVASVELGILGMLGISGSLILNGTAVIALENGLNIMISELCTGSLELLILVSAIIASIGIAWRSRIIGAVAGAVFIVLFNFLRITLTILIILSEPGIETIEFAHDILFRIFLFFAIAIAYIAWFYWAVKRQKQKKGLLA